MSKMSYPRFLLIDGIAAGISVPIFIFLGWHFAREFTHFMRFIARIEHIAIPIILLMVVAAVAVYIVRRRRRVAAVIENG